MGQHNKKVINPETGKKVTPFELSQITRHSVNTMMKYYKRDSELEQLRITEKLSDTMKIKSQYQMDKEGDKEWIFFTEGVQP